VCTRTGTAGSKKRGPWRTGGKYPEVEFAQAVHRFKNPLSVPLWVDFRLKYGWNSFDVRQTYIEFGVCIQWNLVQNNNPPGCNFRCYVRVRRNTVSSFQKSNSVVRSTNARRHSPNETRRQPDSPLLRDDSRDERYS
jgi:hypothetical protein